MPKERAETRMWTRRIDLNICEPMANGFRFSNGLRLFQDRVHCIPQAADDLKAIAAEKLTWLDGLMAGRDFIVGDRLHPGRHPAVRLHRVRRPGRPAARPGQQDPDRLASKDGRAAERRGERLNRATWLVGAVGGGASRPGAAP